MSAEILPFRRPVQKVAHTKKAASGRPAAALDKADRAELNQRIDEIAKYFLPNVSEAENMIRRQIRERYQVKRYDWITSAQFDEFLDDLNKMTSSAWKFWALWDRQRQWRQETRMELFFDSGMDIHAYVDRLLE